VRRASNTSGKAADAGAAALAAAEAVRVAMSGAIPSRRGGGKAMRVPGKAVSAAEEWDRGWPAL